VDVDNLKMDVVMKGAIKK